MGASLLLSKIIDFNAAKERMEHDGNMRMKTSRPECRRHQRTHSNDRLFVQIVACDEQPELVGNTISCCAADISAGGLRIKSYEYIPCGSQLDLWIDSNSRPGKFFLCSEVRWINPMADDPAYRYQLGVELHDGPTTDIEEWRHIYR